MTGSAFPVGIPLAKPPVLSRLSQACVWSAQSAPAHCCAARNMSAPSSSCVQYDSSVCVSPLLRYTFLLLFPPACEPTQMLCLLRRGVGSHHRTVKCPCYGSRSGDLTQPRLVALHRFPEILAWRKPVAGGASMAVVNEWHLPTTLTIPPPHTQSDAASSS